MPVYTRCSSCGVVRRTNDDVCGIRRRDGSRCAGTLILDAGCHSVLFHGPGHQSTTRCELTGQHDLHSAVLPDRRYAEWEGDEAFTGYFDEVKGED